MYPLPTNTSVFVEYVGIPGRVTPTEIALFEQSFHDTCNGITNNTTTTCQGVEFFVWYKRWISLPVPHSLTTTTTTAHGAAIFFCNKIKKTTFVLYPQQGPLSTNFSFVKNALDVATTTTPIVTIVCFEQTIPSLDAVFRMVHPH